MSSWCSSRQLAQAADRGVQLRLRRGSREAAVAARACAAAQLAAVDGQVQ